MRNAISEWQALSVLYERAESLTGDELEAWLDGLVDEGHPLLQPLRQMLGARASIREQGFLDESPALSEALVNRDDDRTGERIGPYRLLARIGRGSRADVWRAERVDGASPRTVAIKLPFRRWSSNGANGALQRVLHERDVLASLDHPGIAGLHDAGVTASGQPWLALECVEGETLTAWSDRARIGVRARVELFRQVLLAVEHAHAHLVIHCDLKPANILVSAVGDVRVLDFGVAGRVEAGGRELDAAGPLRPFGRPLSVACASPEQRTGRPLTTACDVHSLGAVLYELLCGERPCDVPGALRVQPEPAILETNPSPPSRRALGEAVALARGSSGAALRKALAPDLDAITCKALARLPSQRYGSVATLRAEIDRWLAGATVEARVPGRAERIARFVRRHPVGAALGSAAVAVLLLVTGVAVAFGLQAREEAARALAARDFMARLHRQADVDRSRGADVAPREQLDRGRADVSAGRARPRAAPPRRAR